MSCGLMAQKLHWPDQLEVNEYLKGFVQQTGLAGLGAYAQCQQPAVVVVAMMVGLLFIWRI